MIPTAECTKSDLRKARESANLTRWQAGDALGVSQDTIKRWEDPKDNSKPTSADVSRMEGIYGQAGLWYAWMYSNDDGFRDRMAPPTAPDLRESIMKIFASMQDLIDDRAKILRDAADGYIDDRDMAAKIRSLSDDIASASHSLSEEMKRQMEGTP